MKRYHLWLEGEHGEMWDQALIKHLLGEFEEVSAIPDVKDAVVMVAGRQHVNSVERINTELAKLGGVVLLITGDEESEFPVEEVDHPNIRTWVMSPKVGRHDSGRYLPNGWPPMEDIPWIEEKTIDLFFAGQVTHAVRHDCVYAIKNLKAASMKDYTANIQYTQTESFGSGLPAGMYYQGLANSKIAPCPSGPVTPDTFRLYEALELGCLPIVDERDTPGFFSHLFGEAPPFPIVSDWSQLPAVMEECLKDWPHNANAAQAWWMRYKRNLKNRLLADVHAVFGTTPDLSVDEQITVLMPTSPVPANPSTSHTEEAIQSIRERLPKAEVILMIDGVRNDHLHRKADYGEYVRRLLWKANFEWENIYPLVFETHQHQSGMAREAIGHVETDFVLFVEHDTPLVGEIPWDELQTALTEGWAGIIRLSHESHILEPHKYLMIGEPTNNLQRTKQFSSRPYLTSIQQFQKVIDACPGSTMIEDAVYGKVEASPGEWGVAIYHPEGNIQRSTHSDARGDDIKHVGL